MGTEENQELFSKPKLVYPTFNVTYWDKEGNEKETIQVRATTFDNISDLKELQTQLIKDYLNYQGCLFELMSDKAVYSTMQTLAKLLRVVGKKEPGFDITSLYEDGDIVQLGKIFFSENIKADMRSEGWIADKDEAGGFQMSYVRPEHRQLPIHSSIARIHDLPFFQMYSMVKEEIETETDTQTEIVEEAEEVIQEAVEAMEIGEAQSQAGTT